MINIPQIKSQWSFYVIPEQGVILLSETHNRALHGLGYALVLPVIDGKRSASEIVTALAGKMSAPAVYLVLMKLETAGHIREASPDIEPTQAAFWDELEEIPQQARFKIKQAPIVLMTNQNHEEHAIAQQTEVMRRALTEAGLHVTASSDIEDAHRFVNTSNPGESLPQDSPLYVVLTSDYSDKKLLAFGQWAYAARIRWLPVRLNGIQSWMGPLYGHNEKSCHACMVARLDHNRIAHQFIRQCANEGDDALPFSATAAHPATINMACSWAALELIRTLAKNESGLYQRMLCLDHRNGESTQHTLVANPCCTVCGTPIDSTRPVRIDLQQNSPVSHTDGGHRVVMPDVTINKYRHLISPLTGIVNDLFELSSPGSVGHIYVAGHNHALHTNTMMQLRHNMRWASSGKGRTSIQAMAGALCEAIERYSGEPVANDPRDWVLSYDDAVAHQGAENVIHPNMVMAYSPTQFSQRDAINAGSNPFNRIPEPLPPETPISWSPLWSLSKTCVKYIPTQLVRYQALAAPGNKTRYAIGCSNGSASGNTLEEAILQGFCELVERDAVAIWWYNRLRRPAIDLSAFSQDSFIGQLLKEYQGRNRECWALDLTTDLGIPVVIALTRMVKQEQGHEGILMGMGCHLDPRIAVERAFAEMNQMYWMSMPDPATGLPRIKEGDARHWFMHATVASQTYLLPDPNLMPTHVEQFATLSRGNLVADIELCRGIVESNGMEMLVLNQTRDDIGLPVAKVVIPGLRHFWSRLGAGRLYDVPVKMGWLTEPKKESDMNPIAVFI